jgi:hypothetical protein
MLGLSLRQVNEQWYPTREPNRQPDEAWNLLWPYVCLYAILDADEKDGTIPQGTAVAETPEAIWENWRTRRRINSPCHRCVSAFEEKGIEMKKRAAIYARVSTGDQHLETQLLDLREMAKQRGYETVHEYRDIISGSKAKRPGLDQLLADARRHRFDIVLVAAFDRIARNVLHFLDVLDELKVADQRCKEIPRLPSDGLPSG